MSIVGLHRRIRAVTARRSAVRTRLKTHRDLLASGLFIGGLDGFWRRIGTRVPDHLQRTRSGADTDSSVSCSLRSTLRRATLWLAWLLPPWMFLSRGHGVYTIARGTFDGELILLAPRVSVARTPNPSRSLETDTDRRRRFHAHVSSPRFKVEDNLIVEEFIAGRHFGTLDPTAQSECIKRMIGEYTALTRAEGKGTSDSIVHDAARLLEQLSRPAGFPDPVAFRRCVDDAAKWRLVPTAADPQVQNIIVADGNRPIVIDLASMILAPSAYFPLGLLMSAGVPMLQAYLGGEFDAELTELLRASSAVFGATHEDRTALLAVSAAIATRYEARRLSATSDPARLQAILDDSWGLCATLV